MKRSKISVLLVVLTLFCAISLQHATAWAEDGSTAIKAPAPVKVGTEQILGTDGTTDDDRDGDPDTAGDTLGYKRLNDLLGGVDGIDGDQDGSWLELMIQLLDCFSILR